MIFVPFLTVPFTHFPKLTLSPNTPSFSSKMAGCEGHGVEEECRALGPSSLPT